MMDFRVAAVAGGRDGTASEGRLAYFLALRLLQGVALPSSGQLEPTHHVVGEPGEPDIADTIEAHPALECGEDALYLRPDRGDQCVMALLRSAQRRPATPALVHNAVFDPQRTQPRSPCLLGIGLVGIDRPLIAADERVGYHRLVDI